MINETRRCVAAIAYMMIAGKAANGVFDYTLGGFYNMGCTFEGIIYLYLITGEVVMYQAICPICLIIQRHLI